MAEADLAPAIRVEIQKNRTTHAGMGAGNPKKCTHEPGAPATLAPPEEYGSAKAATDPGELGCA